MKIAPMEAEVLLEALGDTDCQLDHNGDCQEHAWFGINGKCPVALSRELVASALKGLEPESQVHQLWRVGRHVGRTVYAMIGSAPSGEDVLIGVMDTPALADAVVTAHNESVGVPRPLVDREALTNAFMARREAAGGCIEGPDCAACRRLAGEEADVALKLARPMPTPEQIAPVLHDQTAGHEWGSQGRRYCGSNCMKRYVRNAEAVLALINGSES